MKIKLLIMVMSVLLLNTAANAAMINYSITLGTGQNWSGAFDVSLLTVAASNTANINGISANTHPSLTLPSTFAQLSPNVTWNATGGDYFSIDSLSLYNAIMTGGGKWNDVLNGGTGGTYSITSARYFIGGGGTDLNNSGGQITFYTTPEPGTMLLLGSGILTFGLSRFRRRKEVASFA